MGIDDAEHGEFAYDYVELTRDVVHGIEGDDSGSPPTEKISQDVDSKA